MVQIVAKGGGFVASSAKKKRTAASKAVPRRQNNRAGSRTTAKEEFTELKKRAAIDVQKLREITGTMVGAVFCSPDGCSYSFYDE
jgi:hypothetical protein